MIKIGIITANELRHKYLRRFLNSIKNFSVEICLAEKNNTRQFYQVLKSNNYSSEEKKHFISRSEFENKFFFNKTKNLKEVKSLFLIDKEEFNTNKKIINIFKKKKIEIVICFGCSIIKNPLLKLFKNKFINIHLGLSPYYRGSATNFWPGVKNKPQFFGSTIMTLDQGIDTATILHQIRPKLSTHDNIHTIGNKIILETITTLPSVIENFKKIKRVRKTGYKSKGYVFKKKDFNKNALYDLKKNFKSGMIKRYLKNKKNIDNKYPIVISKFV